MGRRVALFVLSLCIAHAQRPDFRSGSELVRLAVTVTDRDGHAVRALQRSAFIVSEDGAQRAIEQFAAETVPLTLVVALDLSTSMQGRRIASARSAVLRLLERLQPEDEFVVIGFNDRVFNITDGNKDPGVVKEALERAHPGGATNLYTAVGDGVRLLERAAARPRRALIVISDGRDAVPVPGAPPTQSSAFGDKKITEQREAAALQIVRRSEALVYAIGLDAGNAAGQDVPALRRLTDPTGGITEPVETDDGAVAAAERIGDELRVQYLLGFAPDHHDGKFHAVQVSLSGCDGCRARTRAGFVAARTR